MRSDDHSLSLSETRPAETYSEGSLLPVPRSTSTSPCAAAVVRERCKQFPNCERGCAICGGHGYLENGERPDRPAPSASTIAAMRMADLTKRFERGEMSPDEMARRSELLLAAAAMRWSPVSAKRLGIPAIPANASIGDADVLPEYVVEGIARRGEVTNVVAESKCGKSLLVHQLLVAGACGGKWLDRDVRAGASRLFDVELSRAVIAGRMSKQCEDYGADFNAMCGSVGLSCLNGCGTTMDDIVAELEAVGPGVVDLVVIDPLYLLYAEGKDENDGGYMRDVYLKLKRAAKVTAAAIFVVHHQAKHNPQYGSRRSIDSAAGSGVIARAADNHINLDVKEADGTVLEASMRLRSSEPVPNFYIRRFGVSWLVDDSLTATKGKLPTPERAARAAKKEKSKMSAAEFARRYATGTPEVDAVILERAEADEVSTTKAESLLKRAVKTKQLATNYEKGMQKPQLYWRPDATGAVVAASSSPA